MAKGFIVSESLLNRNRSEGLIADSKKKIEKNGIGVRKE
jgi:hypothetical protein